MFDIGWQEMFIVGLLAIVVIGPRDLPRALKVLAGMIRKARGMARDFQDTFDEVVRESELDDLKKQVERAGRLDIGKRIADHADPTGEIFPALNKDMLDIQSGLDDAPDGVERETDAIRDKTPESATDDPGDTDKRAG